MQIFWEWNKLVSSIRGCHNRARCGLGAKVTDILSKDISGVAVEAGEYVSLPTNTQRVKYPPAVAWA